MLTAGALVALAMPPVGAAADEGGIRNREAAATMAEAAVIEARVVAVGIPGAGAVSEVGHFHPGGPIADKPDFRAYTDAGRVLDENRVLVASTSNFGAARNDPTGYDGSVLSIDPRDGGVLSVPGDLGRNSVQGPALAGAVQLFTAQTPAFANRVDNAGAVSADASSVSYPLGISVNDGFGRLWFANAPGGSGAPGTISILDPGGRPLAGAPDRRAGGVFVGDRTGRATQRIAGGLSGTLATASLGMSPDGSHRAVFAALNGDGSIAQVHTEQGVDGLAPPGTLTPFPLPKPEDVDRGAKVTRAGMVFNWVPNRTLFVSDPPRDAIVALRLQDDGWLFRVGEVRTLTSPSFHTPVDLAPAVPEVANPGFASGSTSSADGDIYVANRGDGTIVRIHQDGTVVAVRRVAVHGVPIGPDRLNGIATSSDARHLWVTITGTSPGGIGTGALLEVGAFDRRSAEGERHQTSVQFAGTDVDATAGKVAFEHAFTPKDGLGPAFNGRSCADCHSSPTLGGGGAKDLGVVHRIGVMTRGAFSRPTGRMVPVSRAHSIDELGWPCGLDTGVPRWANVVSARAAMPLYGIGLIEAVSDDEIRGGADTPGHANMSRGSGGVGRFGWKADVADLDAFVAEAFRNELGITSGRVPDDDGDHMACPTGLAGPDRADVLVRTVAAFLRSLPAPSESPSPSGLASFSAARCDGCHRPDLKTRDGRRVPLFSDLRVHDMGRSLDDGIPQGDATGAEWRTAPLWGLRNRDRFLHDGRASSLSAAILAHDGEGAPAAEAFRRLSPDQRERLLDFLKSI